MLLSAGKILTETIELGRCESRTEVILDGTRHQVRLGGEFPARISELTDEDPGVQRGDIPGDQLLGLKIVAMV